MNDDGTGTITNPEGWNKKANLLFVDQPAGTGFSTGSTEDKSEEEVANDFYEFLQVFFKKNSKYQKNKFYITGESYGGHYVPSIASKVDKMNVQLSQPNSNTEDYININLKGIGIGNGLIDAYLQYPSYPEMAISTNNHSPAVNSYFYELMKLGVPVCQKLISLCESDTFASCLAAVEACNLSLMGPYLSSGLNPYDMRLKCQKPPLCNDYSALTKFLNSNLVKDFLKIPDDKDWAPCNQEVNIQFTLNGDGVKSTKPYVEDLIGKINIVIYAGDQDYICNWLGNKAWVEEMMPKLKDQDMQVWQADGKSAGEWEVDQDVYFVRVYDAGHMVPQDQPKAATELLQRFILRDIDNKQGLMNAPLQERQKLNLRQVIG